MMLSFCFKTPTILFVSEPYFQFLFKKSDEKSKRIGTERGLTEKFHV